MCGRVIRIGPVQALRQIFDLVALPDGLRDRYNLAPNEPITASTSGGPSAGKSSRTSSPGKTRHRW
jgi:hypothetical protein